MNKISIEKYLVNKDAKETKGFRFKRTFDHGYAVVRYELANKGSRIHASFEMREFLNPVLRANVAAKLKGFRSYLQG